MECIYTFNYVKGKEIFGDYINYWWKIKCQAKKENNIVQYTISKVFLNSLYGKWGEKNHRKSKVFNADKFLWEEIEKIDKVKKYLPVACMITAFARMRLVDAVGYNYENFVYADTDSIFTSNIKMMNVDLGDKLGQWKIENDKINTFCFRHRKQYMFIKSNNEPKIVFAGLRLKNENIMIDFFNPEYSKSEKPILGWNEFINGTVIDKQLRPSQKIIRYGRYLEEYEMEIFPVSNATYLKDPDCWFKNQDEYFTMLPSQKHFLTTKNKL